MTAALLVVFALLVLVIGGMFLVAWLDDRICAMRDAADPDKETPPKGYIDPRTAPTDVIPADPDRRKTQRGSWGRA